MGEIYSGESIFENLKSKPVEFNLWKSWAENITEKWIILIQRFSVSYSCEKIGWKSNICSFLIEPFYYILKEFDLNNNTLNNMVFNHKIWVKYFVDTFYPRYDDLKIGPSI